MKITLITKYRELWRLDKKRLSGLSGSTQWITPVMLKSEMFLNVLLLALLCLLKITYSGSKPCFDLFKNKPKTFQVEQFNNAVIGELLKIGKEIIPRSKNTY